MVSDTLIKDKSTKAPLRPPLRESLNTLRKNYEAYKESNKSAPKLSPERLHWLETLSTLDDLTGLANRRGMLDALSRELDRLARGQATTGLILHLELENLNTIRRLHGTDAADNALRLMADTLKSNTRRMDMAARLSGGDFALLMANASPIAAAGRAQSLALTLNSLRLRHMADDIPLHASIAMHPYQAHETPEAILHPKTPPEQKTIQLERAALTRAILNGQL